MSNLHKFVVDSSTLISLSSTCLFNLMKELSKKFNIGFVISEKILEETVGNALKIKRFELNALRISKGLSEGWLKIKKLNEKDRQLLEKVLECANSCYISEHGPLNIIHPGEAEILVLAKSIKAEGMVIDERTTRMLIEEPRRLKALLEKRHRERVKMVPEKARFFKKNFGKLTIIRSSELVALAYEKGLLQKMLGDGSEVLRAALYAVKYNGCALSAEEIERFYRAMTS